ncbi:MAG: hypothetical protein WB764_04365 [Xanthobacteraceae bacterium]
MRPESQELTLRSALSDPLIRTLMAADRVDRRELESMLLRIAEQVTPSLSASTRAGCACWA